MNQSLSRSAAVIAAIVVLLAAGPNAGFQHDPQDLQDPQDPKRSQGFVLKEGEHDLQEVIQRAAKFLGRTYLTTDADFARNPTIKLDKTLNLDAFGCEEVVSQLAYTKDFAMTPVDSSRGIYEFIFTRGPRRPEITTRAVFMTPADVERRPHLKMQVVTTLKLENVSANRATATVRPFFAAGGAGAGSVQIASGGNQSTVLLLGFADQVVAAMKLFRMVDKDAKPSQEVQDRLWKIEQRLTQLERRLRPSAPQSGPRKK